MLYITILIAVSRISNGLHSEAYAAKEQSCILKYTLAHNELLAAVLQLKAIARCSVGDAAVKQAVTLTTRGQRGTYKYTASNIINRKPPHASASKHNHGDGELCKCQDFLGKHLKRLIENKRNNRSCACPSGGEHKVHPYPCPPHLWRAPKETRNSTLRFIPSTCVSHKITGCQRLRGPGGRPPPLTPAVGLWQGSGLWRRHGTRFPPLSFHLLFFFCQRWSHHSAFSAREAVEAQMETAAHKAPFFSVSKLMSMNHRLIGKSAPIPALLFSDIPRALLRCVGTQHQESRASADGSWQSPRRL